jgi:hypothetical protein
LKLTLISRKVLYGEFYHYAALSRNTVDLRLLKQGFHNNPGEAVRASHDESILGVLR